MDAVEAAHEATSEATGHSKWFVSEEPPPAVLVRVHSSLWKLVSRASSVGSEPESELP